ncbi:unnamed protein product [Fusarium fujikuroi]|uniref:Uncharacterized protein n=1 Tax=Fusarium fujikuroi TaxID=5127 RepID=A0A9Q9UAT0_FUSFU|nr:unnamed protein product [Fusarium fujikuroi]VZI05645.1 unnamed protein product [Fusarium fujikuroi]
MLIGILLSELVKDLCTLGTLIESLISTHWQQTFIMHFLTSIIFVTLLGVATAFPGLTPRQNLKNAILICPNAEATFADPKVNMGAVCTRTYSCQYGSDGIKSGNVWTNSCTGCPPDQNVNSFGNCVFQYV